MVFGLASVVDMSTAGSTLIDPIVLQARADEAAAIAAQQAQQTKGKTTTPSFALIGLLAVGGWYWWKSKGAK